MQLLRITIILLCIFFNSVLSQSSQYEETVLITGAGGFVGFHTSLSLTRDGVKVIGLDNLNLYYTPELKRRRVNMLIDKGIEFVIDDVCNPDIWTELFNKYKITKVLHLAAQAGVRYSINHPLEYTRNNVECFVVLLEAMKNKNIPLVYASSSSVYGINKKIPFSESDVVSSPASLYASTKRSDELIAHTYWHLYKQRSVGLRFFTVYGPWGRPDMAYFSFVEDIMNGKPIKMYNHGNAKRDFTYIDDIVQGVKSSLNLNANYEVFNLGNNQTVNLKDFISTIEDALGKKADIISVDMQAGDVPITYANISKAANMLGYSPKTSIKQGIPKFIKWYQEEYSTWKSKPNAIVLARTERYDNCLLDMIDDIRSKGGWNNAQIIILTYNPFDTKMNDLLSKNDRNVDIIEVRRRQPYIPIKYEIFLDSKFRMYGKILYVDYDLKIMKPLKPLFESKIPDPYWFSVYDLLHLKRRKTATNLRRLISFRNLYGVFMVDMTRLPHESMILKSMIPNRYNNSLGGGTLITPQQQQQNQLNSVTHGNIFEHVVVINNCIDEQPVTAYSKKGSIHDFTGFKGCDNTLFAVNDYTCIKK